MDGALSTAISAGGTIGTGDNKATHFSRPSSLYAEAGLLGVTTPKRQNRTLAVRNLIQARAPPGAPRQNRVSLEEDLLKEFDRLITRRGYGVLPQLIH